MAKYNLMATKQDWNNLYEKAEQLGFDVKDFKKSQNFDQAVYAFYVMAKHKLNLTLSEVQAKYQLYSHDNSIKAVIN